MSLTMFESQVGPLYGVAEIEVQAVHLDPRYKFHIYIWLHTLYMYAFYSYSFRTCRIHSPRQQYEMAVEEKLAIEHLQWVEVYILYI